MKTDASLPLFRRRTTESTMPSSINGCKPLGIFIFLVASIDGLEHRFLNNRGDPGQTAVISGSQRPIPMQKHQNHGGVASPTLALVACLLAGAAAAQDGKIEFQTVAVA